MLFHVLVIVLLPLVVFSAELALERVHFDPRLVAHFLPLCFGMAEKMLLGSLYQSERLLAASALGVPAAVVLLHVLQQVAVQLEGGAADVALGGHEV